jgi:hypothetical protein
MTTIDEVRAAFSGKPINAVPTPDGFAAVATWRLDESTIPADQIEARVKEVGGDVIQTAPTALRETNPEGRAISPGERFYVVPDDWLAE